MLSFKYHGHACVEIISGGFRMITDPWFGFPFHFDNMAAYPPIQIPLKEELKDIQLIHISHIHQDHFCRKSLEFFDRNIKILIAKYENKNFYNAIQALGFNQIIEADEHGTTIGPGRFFCFQAEPFDHSYDSLVVIDICGKKILLNNDCVLATDRYEKMQENFGRIDCGFLGYTTVSPYPVCYEIQKMELGAELRRIQRKSIDHVTNLDSIFEFENIFPYANGIRLKDSETLKYNVTFNDSESFSRFNCTTLLTNKICFLRPKSRWKSISKQADHAQPDENIETNIELKNFSKMKNPIQEIGDEHYIHFFDQYFKHFLTKYKLDLKIQVFISSAMQKKNPKYISHFDKQTKIDNRSDCDIRLNLDYEFIDQVIIKNESIASLYYSFHFHAQYFFKPEKTFERIHRWF